MVLNSLDNEAVKIVKEYIDQHLDKSENAPEYGLFIVWKCKILQNAKFLVSSTLFDGMYYEVTYNGDGGVWYLDAYKKFENKEYRWTTL